MRPALGACVFALAVLGSGCVSDEQKRAALIDINQDFRERYETILARKGTRFFPVRRDQAFAALRSTLVGQLGMTEGDESPEIGYLNVYAPAPKPLTDDEWKQAEAKELPRLRELAGKHVGLIAHFLKFEPQGLDIVINATALERGGGSEISLTMRMREVAPPKSGMPRREYAPPTAVDMGLDKIWGALERQLRAARLLKS